MANRIRQLLPSANDAATALATFLTGSDRQAFVDKMNRFLADNACVKESVDYAEQVHFRFYCKSAQSAQMRAALTDRFHGEVHEIFIENAFKEL